MEQTTRHSTNPLTTVALLALFVAGLLFLPLVLSVVEEVTMNSHHVEALCRKIGVHGFFRGIYEAVGIH
jgi:hypothetical protein